MPAHDTAALNRTYGSPGRIAFREGPAEAPLLCLANGHGACEVALYGGQLLSYTPSGHEPLLWLSKSAQRTVPGQAIRGGVPICWPWFGPHPNDFRLPSHGLARTRRWRLMGTASDARQTTARLQLTHDATTLALWPWQFKVELEVTIGEALTLALTTTNKEKRELTLTQALHSYFAVSDIGSIKIEGLERCAYRNAAPGGVDGRQAGAITIDAEFDRVYHQTGQEHTLHDPGLQRSITITKRGSRSTVVWNPWIAKAKALADMADDDYLRFVCIETANADDDTVTLEPGASHTIAMTLRSRRGGAA